MNPGSVSNPVTDDKRAGYLIIEGSSVEMHRVEYDVDQFLRRVEASGHPEGDFIASFHRR